MSYIILRAIFKRTFKITSSLIASGSREASNAVLYIKNPSEDFQQHLVVAVFVETRLIHSQAPDMDRAFRAIVPQYTVFHENERVELERTN